ncbi:hypothetical protein SLS58_005484 [Diplodia intermedia]|uniref:Uncharacterized protein n=1 Tax=Diplodia intermedia TaxID=856260 RepID=A0ABR3TQH0_9PEZI
MNLTDPGAVRPAHARRVPDAGAEEYPSISGGNTIVTATVLLETGMVEMREPVTRLILDAAAVLIGITADCEGGKCKAVSFDHVPSFKYPAWEPCLSISPGAACTTSSSVGLAINDECGTDLICVGERIKRAAQAAYTPVHAEKSDIRGVTVLYFTEPPVDDPDGTKTAVKTVVVVVVVSPGRFDRSPRETGSKRPRGGHAR